MESLQEEKRETVETKRLSNGTLAVVANGSLALGNQLGQQRKATVGGATGEHTVLASLRAIAERLDPSPQQLVWTVSRPSKKGVKIAIGAVNAADSASAAVNRLEQGAGGEAAVSSEYESAIEAGKEEEDEMFVRDGKNEEEDGTGNGGGSSGDVSVGRIGKEKGKARLSGAASNTAARTPASGSSGREKDPAAGARNSVGQALAEFTRALASTDGGRSRHETQSAAMGRGDRVGDQGRGITTFEAEESGILRALFRALLAGRHRERDQERSSGFRHASVGDTETKSVGLPTPTATLDDDQSRYVSGSVREAPSRKEQDKAARPESVATESVAQSGIEFGAVSSGTPSVGLPNGGGVLAKDRSGNDDDSMDVDASMDAATISPDAERNVRQQEGVVPEAISSATTTTTAGKGLADEPAGLTDVAAAPAGIAVAASTGSTADTVSIPGPTASSSSSKLAGRSPPELRFASEPDGDEKDMEGKFPDGQFFAEMGKAFLTPRKEDGKLPMEDLIATTQACLQVRYRCILPWGAGGGGEVRPIGLFIRDFLLLCMAGRKGVMMVFY